MSWVIYHAFESCRTLAQKRELKLAEAVASRNLLAVKKLLNLGVDPNLPIVGQNKEPIIFLAFEKSSFTLPAAKVYAIAQKSYRITAHLGCLRLLLEHGANPDLRDSSGRTPLELAILWCLPEAVRLLLEHGADPNLRNARSQTPLVKAAILGIEDARPMQHKLKIIMDLLDSGAEIDAQTPDGRTALMYAVGHSRLEIVKLLVSRGASLAITDRQGNCARDIINRGSTTQQQHNYLRQILSQPRGNISQYQYRESIPDGDRQLAPAIQQKHSRDNDLN